jgi:hypothetical protein
MIEINKLKAWAVSYDTATNSVLAIFGEKNPNFITVKLSENGMKLIEDVGLEVMPVTDTSFIIVGGHSVVFWNARYVGATEEGDNFEAEYMLFV